MWVATLLCSIISRLVITSTLEMATVDSAVGLHLEINKFVVYNYASGSCFYLRQVNVVNGGDCFHFVRLSVCVCLVCVRVFR